MNQVKRKGEKKERVKSQGETNDVLGVCEHEHTI